MDQRRATRRVKGILEEGLFGAETDSGYIMPSAMRVVQLGAVEPLAVSYRGGMGACPHVLAAPASLC